MIRVRASLVRCDAGATAAEFAIVVPLLLLFLLGIIDVGRLMWIMNQAEKATQMGVRYAVVSDPVADVVGVDFVDEYSIPGGDKVPVATFTSAVCGNTGDCTLTGAVTEDGRNAAAFTNIVAWMQNFYSPIQPDNVRVTYENVGLGYSGDPNGPDVSPLTTVEVHDLSFNPLILFGGTVHLPPIKATLTLEDGECSVTDDCGSSN